MQLQPRRKHCPFGRSRQLSRGADRICSLECALRNLSPEHNPLCSPRRRAPSTASPSRQRSIRRSRRKQCSAARMSISVGHRSGRWPVHSRCASRRSLRAEPYAACIRERALPDPAGEGGTRRFHFIALLRTAAPTFTVTLPLAPAIVVLMSRVQWLQCSLVHVAKASGKQGRSCSLASTRTRPGMRNGHVSMEVAGFLPKQMPLMRLVMHTP